MENERMQKWDTNEDFDKKCIVRFISFHEKMPKYTPYNVLSKDVGIHGQRQAPNLLFLGKPYRSRSSMVSQVG